MAIESTPRSTGTTPLTTTDPLTTTTVNQTATTTPNREVPPEQLGRQGEVPPGSHPVLERPEAMSMEDMMLQLIDLRSKLMDEQTQASKTDIQKNLNKKTAENEERIQKLEEAVDKMADAKKSGTFGKVFGWIATIATVIAAVAMIATGVGAVAGGLMLAGAAIALGMQVFQEAGGMEWLANEIGQEGAQAFMFTMMAIQIALAVGSLGAGLASSSATLAAKAPQLAATLGKTMGGFAAAGTTAGNVGQGVKIAAMAVQGTAMVGQGASSIDTAVKTNAAQKAQASAKEIEADMLKYQMLMEEEMERLKKMLQEIQEGMSIAMQMLSDTYDTKSYLIQQQTI